MVMQSYKEKWALILGGSSGLGLATAKKLASEGMHICIIHRSRRAALHDFENEVKQMATHHIEVIDYNIDV